MTAVQKDNIETLKVGRGPLVGCLLGLGVLLALVLFGVWGVYQSICGFGGLYTIYYLPTPNNLALDVVAAPSGDLSLERRNRVYEVRQTRDELVRFYQQALPRKGWMIRDEGASQSSNDSSYCFVVEQRGIRADIRMVEIPENAITRVFIHFDDPSLCDYPLRRAR